MRRFIALLMACAFAAVLVSPAAAQASSATVVFSGPDKVKAGQTYTYTYRIEVKDVAAARIVPITASGGFELVSGGEGLMYDTIPVNTSGSSSEGTIVVRVKSSARPGDKCTLSCGEGWGVWHVGIRVFRQFYRRGDVRSGQRARRDAQPYTQPHAQLNSDARADYGAQPYAQPYTQPHARRYSRR
jgi:hypothetical protein